MNKGSVLVAMVSLAIGCGGSGSGTTGDGGGSGSMFNTLKGTFTTQSGVSATFSGAMIGYYGSGTQSTWEAIPTWEFSSPTSLGPVAVVSGGQTAKIGIEVSQTGTPAAASDGCSSGDGPNQPLVDFDLIPAGGTLPDATAFISGVTGSSCTLTIDTPTLEQAITPAPHGYYFAHGTLTATLIDQNGTPGANAATMTATW